MDNQDAKQFKEKLTAVLNIYGVDTGKSVLGVWWIALKNYPYEIISKAIDYHVQHGKFAPKPADILELIKSRDGRPTADEAWSIAVRSTDEYVTIAWSDDIAQALSMGASDLLNDGDTIAARMAFRASYDRIIQDARDNGIAVNWSISLGHDVSSRNAEIEKAELSGLISHDKAKLLMTNDSTENGKALIAIATDAVKAATEDDKEKHKQRIEGLRKAINKKSKLNVASN